ncbi:MAG: RNA-binding S4 domain-containing protein [Propionibacteriaceae bacterium]|jgi:ribosome-associated heat shock protein Hsp15|nr:RNA-binding S4 domain-containing protein [Propionibacteriaceae bacterium]
MATDTKAREDLVSARVDSWLWAVRLFPSRSAATTACRAGHVRLNDDSAKPASQVKVGDTVRVRASGHPGRQERVVIVKRLIVKRVGAAVAVECYEDHSPPPVDRVANPPVAVRDRGAGRPTKRDRRLTDQLRGRG